jgi:hypothetical protein
MLKIPKKYRQALARMAAKARAAKLTPEQRREIATKASKAAAEARTEKAAAKKKAEKNARHA